MLRSGPLFIVGRALLGPVTRIDDGIVRDEVVVARGHFEDERERRGRQASSSSSETDGTLSRLGRHRSGSDAIPGHAEPGNRGGTDKDDKSPSP